MRLRLAYTDHLVRLVAEAERAAERLRAVDPDQARRAAHAARRERAFLSARLDGSPIDAELAAAVDRGEAPTVSSEQLGAAARDASGPGAQPPSPASGWAQVLRLDDLADREIIALEYANLVVAAEAESTLAARFLHDPGGVLAELHELLCGGLVDPAVVGKLRQTEQAVHDGAQGKVIYEPVGPEDLPALYPGLIHWLGAGSAAVPASLAAGVLHGRWLQWHPYEAANGRLARAAAHLLLRARGFDPWGVAVVERELASDAVGYYGEIAATIRRRGDLVGWLERWMEALVAALWRATDELDPAQRPQPGSRALSALTAIPAGGTVTVVEHASAYGLSREDAWADLRALARSDALELVPGTAGLRYRRSAGPRL